MARMPWRVQASMISRRSPCLRTVAVFSDSQRWSLEKSRMSAIDAAGGEHQLHAPGRELGISQQTGLVGEPEQFGEMQRGARALLAADHGEVVLMAVEISHEHHAGLVEPGRRLEDVTRQRHRRAKH